MPDALGELGQLVSQRRAELGLSLREASGLAGVPVATLSRVEQGRTPDLATFQRLIEWLGVPPERFFKATERVANTPDAIAAHLNMDPSLSPEAADKIAGIVRDLYESLAIRERRLTVHLRAAKTFTPPAMRLFAELLAQMQEALDSSHTRG
jgi:transcriptional regulator with XRE-family HTH domain